MCNWGTFTIAALNADHAPAPNHARYQRPEPSSATPQPSCPSVLSRSRCCTALLADDSLPRDLEILAPWTSGAWAASIRSASWQSVCEANGSGSLAHHGRVEPGLVELRQKDLLAHRDPGAEAGRAELEGIVTSEHARRRKVKKSETDQNCTDNTAELRSS